MKYKVYLTCDGKTLTTGTMDLAVFSSTNSVFSEQTVEVQVGYPALLLSPCLLSPHPTPHKPVGRNWGGCPACLPAPLLPLTIPYYTLAQVGYPKCVGDRVADNTTWFEVDGRDCMCDKGTLFCKKVQGTAASLYYPCSSLFRPLSPDYSGVQSSEFRVCSSQDTIDLTAHPTPVQAAPGSYFLMNEGESVRALLDQLYALRIAP